MKTGNLNKHIITQRTKGNGKPGLIVPVSLRQSRGDRAQDPSDQRETTHEASGNSGRSACAFRVLNAEKSKAERILEGPGGGGARL